MYNSEPQFENDLITFLFDYGWNNKVIKYPTEEELIRNWAKILYDNNRGIDKLGDYPLTDGEMRQIISKINELHTPCALNEFINGKTVTIVRENTDDTLHFGKPVALSIYDRNQIASGKSVYQIAEQPKFPTAHPLASDRRGDLMLLINGMPVIHVELKKSKIPVSQAVNQIKKYYHEGIFSQGIFSLVQVFVAMNPEETLYFANPGSDDNFNTRYMFHWADFNNNPQNDWKYIATHLLSIPMAHQLIGFYTVADKLEGNLKVMRSYQYYAANAISDRVAGCHWNDRDIMGGYIWHTTGSGKTMTSFKSAQLIADSGKADKVVFLMDRIELGTQTALEYRGFKNESEDVQETENTVELIGRLKSPEPTNTLIVTSIQKMSRILPDTTNQHDLNIINSKRIVIIVDECHRDTFGEMLSNIRLTFRRAIFFGFSGTPIQDENSRLGMTTKEVFGNELHRYSIADGIRDENVLGFDPQPVCVYDPAKLRQRVALAQSGATSEEEALNNPDKAEIYLRFMNEVPMAGELVGEDKTYVKGIEDYIPKSMFDTFRYKKAVVDDIIKTLRVRTCNYKYHAIFATSSIRDALDYYTLLRTYAPHIKSACLVDPTIDNNGGGEIKEEALLKVLTNYNEQYNTKFKMPTFDLYKKDVALRLAHKDVYKGVENVPDLKLDLLIVVNQMLTGYDSHWVNTLYLDKVLRNEHLVQAFSRTNRLKDSDKTHGTIRYYRYPYTMQRLTEEAIAIYSGDRPLGVCTISLAQHIENINAEYSTIQFLFESAGITDFSRLPDEGVVCGQFAKAFRNLFKNLNAATIQGFQWTPIVHTESPTGRHLEVEVKLDKITYDILLQRYKELARHDKGQGDIEDVYFDLDADITEINTNKIDQDYMNSRFQKYIRNIQNYAGEEELAQSLDELHRSFATLSQEEQQYAERFLHDVQNGIIQSVDPSKSLSDYISEYISKDRNDRVHRFSETFGLDEDILNRVMLHYQEGGDINEFGLFDMLRASINKEKAGAYFAPQGVTGWRVNTQTEKLLREFIEQGGFEI